VNGHAQTIQREHAQRHDFTEDDGANRLGHHRELHAMRFEDVGFG